MKIHQSQSGNVLFLIFIAIGLFAALSYAVSDGSRGGAGTISKEQARLAAASLVQQFTSIKNGYDHLISKGCSEMEIDMDAGNYNNPVAGHNLPTERCDLESPEGAGIAKLSFKENWQSNIPDVSDVGTQSMRVYYIGSANEKNNKDGGNPVAKVYGVGRDDLADYMIHFNFVTPEICTEYNKIVGIEGIPIHLTQNDKIWGNEDSRLFGKMTACASTTTASGAQNYQIYFVYAPR